MLSKYKEVIDDYFSNEDPMCHIFLESLGNIQHDGPTHHDHHQDKTALLPLPLQLKLEFNTEHKQKLELNLKPPHPNKLKMKTELSTVELWLVYLIF